MVYHITDIASALGTHVLGATDIVVRGAAEPSAAGPDDLALAMTPKYIDALAQGRGAARVALVRDGVDWRALGLEAVIVVTRPRHAMAGLTTMLDPGPDIDPGIHATALIHPKAQVGEGAAIGPYAVIGADVRIGARARIAAHVTIGAGTIIGYDVLVHAGVRLGPRLQIGDRVILHPGAIIGGDGFSFVTPEQNQVERARESLGKDDTAGPQQSWTRIHSLGAVVLGDDVEIGANTAIDRGTIANTMIGNGTKIDNLVHVGHNCQIGQDCLLCGQVGLAGSVVTGDRVVLGGQVGVSDNVTVGSDVVASGGSAIFSNVPGGRVVMGYPAVKMDTHVEMYKSLRRLPRLIATITKLRKVVFKTPDKS